MLDQHICSTWDMEDHQEPTEHSRKLTGKVVALGWQQMTAKGRPANVGKCLLVRGNFINGRANRN